MRYATVCSGIEAPSVAWDSLGWKPVFFSEIEKFPSQVLNHHYPNTPNLGDMNQIDGTKYNGSVDLICGGTPCQSFSVAGLRKGMSDPRGNLALVFLRLVDQIRPTWVVWENVPGVLSSNKGRDFGSFVGGLGQLGYGWTYRVLDAQYFGVPQRRRRVFVVGHIGGDWKRAAEVLFEQGGGTGHFAPGRKKRERIAGSVEAGTSTYRWQNDKDGLVNDAGGVMIFDPNQITSKTNRSIPTPELCHTMPASEQPPTLYGGHGVRRITPVEAERLQGFPDNYTKINDKTADGPRYKALGNSMAVPVMRWIGERINNQK